MNNIEEIRLSQWAKENGKTYKQAWSMVKNGSFPDKTIETKTGRITVLKESKASEQTKFATPTFADVEKKKETSLASRRNRAATIIPTDQYKHIEDGLEVFTLGDRGGKSGDNCINVSEAIRLVRKAYWNFSDLMNILNTLVEFSTSPIYYRGGNAKSRNFFEALFNRLNILNLQQKFFMEYYRSCNVFPYRYETVLKEEDINNLNKVYGTKASKKVKLPIKYIIIDPASVVVGGNINFANAQFFQRLNSYEVQRLIKPITQEDKDFYNALPNEVKEALDKKNNNQLVDIPLDPKYVYFIFYKKQDYEPMAVPMAWPVLKDINAKAELKAIDMAVARTTQRAILVITMGYENKEGHYMFDAKAAEAMRLLFDSESVGKVLVADFTTKVEWVIPEIDKLLGKSKYEQLNDDIKTGLNNILVGSDEKFANQSIKVKLFIQRLVQSREVFINEFLLPEIKRISKDMGFKTYPTPYFQDIDFKDQDLWNRIIMQMVQLGLLTSWEANEAIENGVLPDKEISIENQREFKELKDEGLFQTPQLNPSTQLEVLDKQGKQQEKMQTKQFEHDEKEKGKDRKHAAENPQAPAPQIVLNAPTKMGQPKGAPKGTKKPNTKKKVKPISASLIRKNLIVATESNKELEKQLLKKFNLKQLDEEQSRLKDTLLENIMGSENVDNWNKKEVIASYIAQPDKINQEKFEEVRKISEEHKVNDYLGAILYHSQGEEVEIEETEEDAS